MRGYLASILDWLEIADCTDGLAPPNDFVRHHRSPGSGREWLVDAHRRAPL